PFVLELLREAAAKSPSPLTKEGYRGFRMAGQHDTASQPQVAAMASITGVGRGPTPLSILRCSSTSQNLARPFRLLFRGRQDNRRTGPGLVLSPGIIATLFLAAALVRVSCGVPQPVRQRRTGRTYFRWIRDHRAYDAEHGSNAGLVGRFARPRLFFHGQQLQHR